MRLSDAAAILGLEGDITPEDVKKAYRVGCSKYHPDRNPAGAEMMKMINLAYETLRTYTGTVETEETVRGYGQAVMNALNAISGLGLDIEICGAWVWVSGNTKPHRQALKDAEFRWAPKKKMWYFRPDDYKSWNRGTWSMDDIRAHHGSTKYRDSGPRRLQGGTE